MRCNNCCTRLTSWFYNSNKTASSKKVDTKTASVAKAAIEVGQEVIKSAPTSVPTPPEKPKAKPAATTVQGVETSSSSSSAAAAVFGGTELRKRNEKNSISVPRPPSEHVALQWTVQPSAEAKAPQLPPKKQPSSKKVETPTETAPKIQSKAEASTPKSNFDFSQLTVDPSLPYND